MSGTFQNIFVDVLLSPKLIAFAEILKTSLACLLNPTTNTPDLDPPARFLLLALIGKYFKEIFPNPDRPRGIHL